MWSVNTVHRKAGALPAARAMPSPRLLLRLSHLVENDMRNDWYVREHPEGAAVPLPGRGGPRAYEPGGQPAAQRLSAG